MEFEYCIVRYHSLSNPYLNAFLILVSPLFSLLVFYLSSVGGESGNNNTNDTNCNEKCDNGHDIQWEEVPADGLYLLDLNKMTTTNMVNPQTKTIDFPQNGVFD